MPLLEVDESCNFKLITDFVIVLSSFITNQIIPILICLWVWMLGYLHTCSCNSAPSKWWKCYINQFLQEKKMRFWHYLKALRTKSSYLKEAQIWGKNELVHFKAHSKMLSRPTLSTDYIIWSLGPIESFQSQTWARSMWRFLRKTTQKFIGSKPLNAEGKKSIQPLRQSDFYSLHKTGAKCLLCDTFIKDSEKGR